VKIKHNKLRNPSILFELLVRQVTTDTLSNQDSKALGIIKKYYNNTEVAKEYNIYNTIVSTKNLSEQRADMLINAAVEAYRKLNKATLRKQKYELVSEIKNNYNIEEFFKSKVDNYKTLASIYLLFEMENPEFIDPTKYADCKYTILESISAKTTPVPKDELLETFNSYDKGTRALVYQLMIEKFNETYSDLNNKQKQLLKEYISNISTTDKLREYVNTELQAVRKALKQQIRTIDGDARMEKLNEVLSFVKEVPATKKVGENEIHDLLSYYELLKEFETLETA
jgi:hypothetical protein